MSGRSSDQNPWGKFYGPNLGYVVEQYERYAKDPSSVDPELARLFERWGAPYGSVIREGDKSGFQPGLENGAELQKIFAAYRLAEEIRMHGHRFADLDPLDRKKIRPDFARKFHLSEADLEALPPTSIGHFLPGAVENVRDAIRHLEEVYMGPIAYEFFHIENEEERRWLAEFIESGAHVSDPEPERKRQLLKRLMEVEIFEQFLHRTFVGQKRFSIEGIDVLVPLLDEIIGETVKRGVRSVNIGMAHRGRLNVLAHVFGKPYELIFSEFLHAPNKDLIPSEGSIGITYGWTGDVKYHLGLGREIRYDGAVRTRLTLANNPSHLEFVNPVVAGFTRAAQEDRTVRGFPKQDVDRALGILIHGDAAFPGQGVVAETLNLGRLKGYQTGGIIHIIANNRIGFTTESEDSRSTRYASDLAKGFSIPVVHVNADEPEAVLAAARLAVSYRQRFHKDIVIDLIGYRRYGHNEMDEPLATNPLMYRSIQKHPTVKTLYGQRLKEKGIVKEEEIRNMEAAVKERLKAAFEKVPKSAEGKPDMDPPGWLETGLPELDTRFSPDELERLNEEMLHWPDGFKPFKKLERILRRRKEAFLEGKIDWAHAEALAFATLLKEGVPIRLSGQDSERGTFAQRHLILHDFETGDTFSPLHLLGDVQASFAVYNSPLSETSILGFEYGYNVFAPETLVLWEAQFGDFANSAQVIIDQFIASGRAKWGQKSGLVLLLPHGYEGQGPEHSSARLERYLSLAAENNWIIVNMTKSSQYFHVLRRQARLLPREEVRPLVVMSPKSLLRHPLVASTAGELAEGRFYPILEQSGLGKDAENVERLILCTGKIAIELEAHLSRLERKDWFHIVRIEELYPFPMKELAEVIARYPKMKELVWVQEEPKNMGAWSFVEPRLHVLAPAGTEVFYIGRRPRSSTAEGDPLVHKKEQSRIIEQAFQRTAAFSASDEKRDIFRLSI
jgi:2-oxoglutarate dehydrogenase E1 component (EC 1.2.4.2)